MPNISSEDYVHYANKAYEHKDLINRATKAYEHPDTQQFLLNAKKMGEQVSTHASNAHEQFNTKYYSQQGK